jgi:hypothetical protein
MVMQCGRAKRKICTGLFGCSLTMSMLLERQTLFVSQKSFGKFLNDTENNNLESSAYSVSYQGKAGSLRTDRWRYNRWGEDFQNGNEELYDHHNDPEENVNLANHKNMINIMKEMRGKFEKARIRARVVL